MILIKKKSQVIFRKERENRSEGVNMSQCTSMALVSLSQKQISKTGKSREKRVWGKEKYRIAALRQFLQSPMVHQIPKVYMERD